jgi:hypothetical protein
VNGEEVWLEEHAARFYKFWKDAAFTVPIDATEASALGWVQGTAAGRLVDGVTLEDVTITGDIFRDPVILNNGSGNLEGYFAPADEDTTETVTGVFHATSTDYGQTWTVDPVLNGSEYNGSIALEGALSGTIVGALQHIWSPGHATNPSTVVPGDVDGGGTIYMKTGLDAGAAALDGQPFTLVNSDWTSLNGDHVYAEYLGFERFYLWANSDFTGETYPTQAEYDASAVPGYLPGPLAGDLMEGHVNPSPPGVAPTAIVEMGGERWLFAADKFGNHTLFTATAGNNGPFTGEDVLVENGVTGSPVISNTPRSADVIPALTGKTIYLYLDGNFNGALDNEASEGALGLLTPNDDGNGHVFQVHDFVRIDDPAGGGSRNDPAGGVPITFANSVADAGMTALEEASLAEAAFAANRMTALLLVIGAVDDPAGWDTFGGQPDPRSSHDHDIFYAPLTVDFNQNFGPHGFSNHRFLHRKPHPGRRRHFRRRRRQR